jgi:hypothetical protein
MGSAEISGLILCAAHSLQRAVVLRGRVSAEVVGPRFREVKSQAHFCKKKINIRFMSLYCGIYMVIARELTERVFRQVQCETFAVQGVNKNVAARGR